MPISNEINWPDSIWQNINQEVVKEVNKVRVLQKVLPTRKFDNDPSQIPDEVIDFTNLSIKEGATKPFVEIHVEFSLTSNQVQLEAEQKTCLTLAKMAAKALALAEDKYFFQRSDKNSNEVNFPANVTVENWRTNLEFGLLAEANPDETNDEDPTKVSAPIPVRRAKYSNAKWGEETFKAVTNGIAKLVDKAQAPNYALILPTEVYADTFVPPSSASLVTTADRIKPLVEGGFFSSGVLPKREGLLMALGGEPTKLYVGLEAKTEFVRKEGAKYFFRVVERVQYVVRDSRSLVLLKFADEEEPDSKDEEE